MLQVKNLVKRYQTKGETVTALDGVSVNFPERGMVFLLGKSGSGKSTLLNVSGGLDEPDEGEIIVKGKSSKDFSKSDFDSYRNTYVGFIFQEYNILNELTIAENVALAIELQGKSRNDAIVDSLLEQVGLEGMGDRRPNTLSGGQKQRVAIARALVKSPEIIMADEPTGALDSATGTQVFDTLKNLSHEKLVVVVSHDRDFAEKYADRIIELKDGQIISDVTRGEGQTAQENVFAVSDKTLTVSSGVSLTDDEAERILAFVKKNKGSVVISAEKERMNVFAAEYCGQSGFVRTQAAEVSPQKDESNFIKSSFPLRYAVKMGVSGLKFKPIRLAFTILLATLAFIVFGVFSTLLTFNGNKITANALVNSDYGAAVVMKDGVYHFNANGNKYTRRYSPSGATARFTPAEIDRILSAYPAMNFIPVFTFNVGLLIFSNEQGRNSASYSNFYNAIDAFSGFAEVSYLEGNRDIDLVAGSLPQKDGEAAVSLAVFENYRFFGYSYEDESGRGIRESIDDYEDLIGKRITIRASATAQFRLTVTAIVDTHETFSSFDYLKDRSGDLTTEELYQARTKLAETFRYSMASICFVSRDFYPQNSFLDTSNESYDSFLFQMERWFYNFEYTNNEETEDSYCQYLYSSLNSNRVAKCNDLINGFHRVTDEQNDIYYHAGPYSFISDISSSEGLLNTLISIIGSAAGVLAVFAALLLFNFISASINAKKKDIGILRAVGARSIDVFKIFLVEGLIITLLCFALGCIGSVIACTVANFVIIDKAVLTFNFFLFDGLNALIVLGIALVTALIATVIPVALNARKKPVDAIRAI